MCEGSAPHEKQECIVYRKWALDVNRVWIVFAKKFGYAPFEARQGPPLRPASGYSNGRIIAISGQVKGSACLVQFMQPV